MKNKFMNSDKMMKIKRNQQNVTWKMKSLLKRKFQNHVFLSFYGSRKRNDLFRAFFVGHKSSCDVPVHSFPTPMVTEDLICADFVYLMSESNNL